MRGAGRDCASARHAGRSENVQSIRQQPKSLLLIALRNVKPRLMAFWLDPKNHPAPPEFAPPSGRESPVPAKVSPQLPEGIDRIVVIDAQNALLVFGTEAGVGQLRRIIAFLDKTQRQVEVEAFLVSIPNANLTGIWADLAAQTQGVRLAMGLVGNDERQWLHGAIAGKRAQILALRHPTFINGTTQRFDFAPPAPRRKAPNPLLPEDFSSPMPVIPPPKGMAEMPECGGAAHRKWPVRRNPSVRCASKSPPPSIAITHSHLKAKFPV